MREQPDTDDFQRAGLYDPDDEHAPERLELLRFLVECGATLDELVAGRDELPGVASRVLLRTGEARFTVTEVAERSGLESDLVLRIWRAAGFPDPDPEDRQFSEDEAELFAALHAGEALVDREAILQLIRVMGSAMSRVADAFGSAFVVNVALNADEDATGLGLARANAFAANMVPEATRFLDVLLRRHMQVARRPVTSLESGAGYGTQRLVVGFADLVGSTEMVRALPLAELGAAVSDFESVAADVVTSAGGRVVKLIGDEVMFVVPEIAAACDIGLTLSELVDLHPTLRAVRVAIAEGDVLSRGGDFYGPTVNLAARAVKLAPPGGLVAPADVARHVDATAEPRFRAEPLGERELTGFDTPVDLCRILRSEA